MISLDITSPSCDLNFNSDRQVAIEFVGGTHRNRLQTGYAYTVSIPYNSLSQRIREIQRFGGKIIDVTILKQKFATSQNPEIITSESRVPETVVQPIAIAPEVEAKSTNIATEKDLDLAAAPVTESKPKRSRASSKAGSDLNKSKPETKTTRSPRKTKS
jgi:hypothetical protein